MSSLSSLSMNLLLIRQTLLKHPVFVRGYGVPVDDASFVSETRELEAMSERLALIVRELRSKANLLQVREQNLWNVPHERRWSAASSIRQQDRELEQVLEMSADIQHLIEDLMRKSGLLSQGDVAANIGELINKLYQQSHSGTLIGAHGGQGPVYTPYTAGQFENSPEAATILVFVALRALTYLFKPDKSSSAA